MYSEFRDSDIQDLQMKITKIKESLDAVRDRVNEAETLNRWDAADKDSDKAIELMKKQWGLFVEGLKKII